MASVQSTATISVALWKDTGEVVLSAAKYQELVGIQEQFKALKQVNASLKDKISTLERKLRKKKQEIKQSTDYTQQLEKLLETSKEKELEKQEKLSETEKQIQRLTEKVKSMQEIVRHLRHSRVSIDESKRASSSEALKLPPSASKESRHKSRFPALPQTLSSSVRSHLRAASLAPESGDLDFFSNIGLPNAK